MVIFQKVLRHRPLVPLISITAIFSLLFMQLGGPDVSLWWGSLTLFIEHKICVVMVSDVVLLCGDLRTSDTCNLVIMRREN